MHTNITAYSRDSRVHSITSCYTHTTLYLPSKIYFRDDAATCTCTSNSTESKCHFGNFLLRSGHLLRILSMSHRKMSEEARRNQRKKSKRPVDNITWKPLLLTPRVFFTPLGSSAVRMCGVWLWNAWRCAIGCFSANKHSHFSWDCG